MAQQPNIEITEATAPRHKLEPGPAAGWRATKPGVPMAPGDVPRGGGFGYTGPDPGWALKLIAEADLPGDDPRLRQVVTGLVMARAAALGRAAIPEDIEAALILAGQGDDPIPDAVERGKRWLAAVPHDKRPGATAVAQVDNELLVAKPEQIRMAYRLRGNV